MARFSTGVRTGAGSTTLPILSLYSTATIGAKLREVGIFNTTATAVELYLCRLTTAGTQGAGIVETGHDPDNPPACTAFTTHTGNPTLGGDLGYRGVLGAAIGSGIIWTFGDSGIRIPVGTGNGIGVLVATGTGQVCQAYLVWDE
jgi:hypothetical protein